MCVPPKDLNDDPSEMDQNLVGWRLMRRLPADNKFHEAVITGYNPVKVCSFLSFSIVRSIHLKCILIEFA